MTTIHCLPIGSIQVKQAFMRGSIEAGGIGRFFLAIQRDREWGPVLPIYAWLIEHAEGLILIDSGETAASVSRFAPGRVRIAEHEELPAQLRRLGVPPGDIRQVILTHTHTDHINGLIHLPPLPVAISADEARFMRSLGGRIERRFFMRLPRWFAPRELRFAPEPCGAFPESVALTKAGDIRAVPTPGHSVGHLSVIIDDGDRDIVLAGDATYSDKALLEDRIEGLSRLPDAHRATLRRLRDHASRRPTVYLPSHDEDAPRRLAARETLPLRRELATA